MRLDRVAWHRDGAVPELRARATFRDETCPSVELWFRSDALPVDDHAADASPFLPALLLWCMAGGEELRIEAGVSQRMLDAADDVARVCVSFWPEKMRPVPVTASARALEAGRPRTACFFSRGVDSWHSVLTATDHPERPPLSLLVHMPGRDLPPDPTPVLLESSLRAVRAASREAGLALVMIDTNLFEALPRRLDWNTMHGAVMAGAGLALGPTRMLFPASVVGDHWFPWGSHPDLDPLFSTERTEVVHHGNVQRLDKVRRVARSPLALRWLRVCHRRTPRNCGRCEKCLRTMVELHLVGALADCPGFERQLEPAAVAATSSGVGGRVHWWEVLRAMGSGPEHRELAGAIELLLLRSELRDIRARIAALGNGSGPSHLAAAPPADVREARRAVREAMRTLERIAAAYGRPSEADPPAPPLQPAPPEPR